MPNSAIHKSRIIRLLKQYPSRLKEIFPPDRFADAAKAIKALQSSPHSWFIDGTLAENYRVTAKSDKYLGLDYLFEEEKTQSAEEAAATKPAQAADMYARTP
jgi:hypothetical protein